VAARRPNLFLVGAPKSGTTSMTDALDQHPEIAMCPVKEPNFFVADLGLSIVDDVEEYLALFPAVHDEKWVGEASVWYLHSRRAASQIREFSPSARILIMLRNPVDMMYALHAQCLYNGVEEIEDFEAALEAEAGPDAERRFPRRFPAPPDLTYRGAVEYSTQIRRYFDAFGRECVRVIVLDDFQVDPLGTYRRTCEFLEVGPDFGPEVRLLNPSHRSRSRRLVPLIEDRSALPRRAARAVLPAPVRHSAGAWLRRANTKYEQRAPMPPRLRERLHAELRPEVERLSELLGRDLNPWCERVGEGQ
jgi:hypothetical protein